MRDRDSIPGPDALRALLESSPFHGFLKLEVDRLDKEAGELVLRLPYKDTYQRQPRSGYVHGGVLAALVDVAGAFAMISFVGRNVPTTSLHVDYLRPVIASDLRATATVRRAGKTVGLVDVEVHDADGKLAALGRVSLSTGGGGTDE